MWRYILPTERLYIDKDKIIAKNASGTEVFNTNWNFIKTQSSGQFKVSGYNQAPIFTLTEGVRTNVEYSNQGIPSFGKYSVGIIETVDNTYKGGQLALIKKMGPDPQQYLSGGVKWGTGLTFWLPSNDTGYCSWNMQRGLYTTMPYSSETTLSWLLGGYYNQNADYGSPGSGVLGHSGLLNITINGTIVGKYRWYAIESGSSYGAGGWNVNVFPGPAILESGMLSYWQSGGLMEWSSTTNRTCTNGYVVPSDTTTGVPHTVILGRRCDHFR